MNKLFVWPEVRGPDDKILLPKHGAPVAEMEWLEWEVAHTSGWRNYNPDVHPVGYVVNVMFYANKLTCVPDSMHENWSAELWYRKEPLIGFEGTVIRSAVRTQPRWMTKNSEGELTFMCNEEPYSVGDTSLVV